MISHLITDHATVHMTPRECYICGTYFASNFSLKRHQTTMHPNDDDVVDMESRTSDVDPSVSSDEDRSSRDGYDSDDDSERSSQDGYESDDESEDVSDVESENEQPVVLDKFLLDMKKLAWKPHMKEMDELIEQFESEGLTDDKAVRRIKKLLTPKVRKTLRQVMEKKIVEVDRIRRNQLYKRIMETAKDLIADEAYSRSAAIRFAVAKHKYIIYDIIPSAESDTDSSESDSDDELDSD